MKIILILLMLILIYILMLFLIYRKAFYRYNKSKLFSIKYTDKQKEIQKNTLKELEKYYKKEKEKIKINSFDDIELYAEYYHQKDRSPIIISFHGYKGNMYDNNLGIKKVAFENNYNLLLVSQRAHGKSKGNTITFGIKERRDAISWINYVINKYPKNKIILAGSSLGAATILMASDLIHSKNVVGLIADCPFSDPQEIIKKYLKDRKYPVNISMYLIHLSGLIFGNFNIKYHNVLKSVKKTKLPILLIHSKNDKIIPYQMSEQIQKNAKSKPELHLIDNCDHCAGYFEEPKTYEKLILDFIKKVSK